MRTCVQVTWEVRWGVGLTAPETRRCGQEFMQQQIPACVTRTGLRRKPGALALAMLLETCRGRGKKGPLTHNRKATGSPDIFFFKGPETVLAILRQTELNRIKGSFTSPGQDMKADRQKENIRDRVRWILSQTEPFLGFRRK